jgi:hypothetical protein
MPYSANPGILTPYNSINVSAVPFDVFRIGINWMPDRCPLLARLAKVPLGSLKFELNNDNYRPRNPISRTNAAYTSTGTSITVLDGTVFTPGDVLLIESERFLVTAVNNNHTITVTYAFENTTQANHANNTAVTLITNAETGAAVDKNAQSRIPTTVEQYSQTVQHAYQVGGMFNSTSAYMGGDITPLQRDKQMAMQHVMDDFESALYYGKGTTGGFSSTLNNQTMKGLQTLITTNTTASPTNAGSYKPTDFTRDTLQACFSNGGKPDIILVSQDFLTGMTQWGWTLQRLDQPVSELGIAADTFVVPFLGGTRIIPAPLLRAGTAVAFNSNEVRVRLKRKLFDQERGVRGDAFEGDMIMEGSLELHNEYKCAWVSGVTGFAVQS